MRRPLPEAARLLPKLLLGFLVAAAWHLALRNYGFSLPLISDEGEYAYQARIWSEGGLPYRDGFCQKPPMAFLLYRFALAAWPGDLIGPRRLALLFSLATMAALLLLTPRRWCLPARLAAPAVYGVLCTAPIGSLGFPANTEVFLCAFTAAAALSLWSADGRPKGAFFCGLFCGAALMTKQTAVATILAFAAIALWRAKGEKARTAAAGLAGLSAVPAAFLGYFLARGGLGPLWRDAFAGNLRYASMAILTSSLWSQTRWLFAYILPAFLLPHWPAHAAAAFGLAGRRIDGESVETLAAVWLGTGLVGALAGFLFFPYYFLQAFPPLALLAASGCQRLGERLGRRWPAAAVAFLCGYPALVHARPYFRDRGEVLARKLMYPNPLFEAKALGEYVAGRIAPGEPFYIFGSEPQIYVYAGRRCATVHDFVYPLTLFGADSAEVRRELEALRESKPKLILYSCQPGSSIVVTSLGRSFQEGVKDLLAREYRLIGALDILEYRTVYRLGGSPAREPADFSPRDSVLVFERRSRGR